MTRWVSRKRYNLDLNPLTFDWIKRKASKIYQGMNDVIAGTGPAIHKQGRQGVNKQG